MNNADKKLSLNVTLLRQIVVEANKYKFRREVQPPLNSNFAGSKHKAFISHNRFTRFMLGGFGRLIRDLRIWM